MTDLKPLETIVHDCKVCGKDQIMRFDGMMFTEKDMIEYGLFDYKDMGYFTCKRCRGTYCYNVNEIEYNR